MTKYSTKIFNLINNSRSHMTAEQIYLNLKKTEPKIVLATVYNNLNTLCSKNLIRKIGVDGEADRYDNIVKHDHLICSKCGKLADFNFADLTDNLRRQLEFEIFKYDLKVYYECPDCKNKI